MCCCPCASRAIHQLAAAIAARPLRGESEGARLSSAYAAERAAADDASSESGGVEAEKKSVCTPTEGDIGSGAHGGGR